MKLIIAFIFKIQAFSLVSAAGYDFGLSDFQVAANRFRRAATKSSCLQPPSTPDKHYTVDFPQKDDIFDAKPGEVVPQFTILKSKCNEGYAADYQTDVTTEFPSVCTNGKWQPPVVQCKKICDNFSKFSKFNMSCYEYVSGPKISCHGLLLERAIVIPRCQEKFHPDIKVNYDYATCREDGTWDKPFFKCVSDCGQSASNSVPLIANGEDEQRGGAPWNVAIYSTEVKTAGPKFICGGTLINEDVVISAAHCFYDEIFRKIQKIEWFEIIVGKATPGYEKRDYTTTKTYRINNIYYPSSYRGSITNYASDLAILHLAEKVSFSGDVLPACLHLYEREHFNPGENVKGKLSGFGKTRDDSEATKLYTAYLPYISHAECLKKVEEDFLRSVTTDKFCAGSENGPGARRGDSGGGLLFVDNTTGLYFLRGVVSTKDTSNSSVATFTDIAQYMSWIVRFIEPIKRKSACECDTIGSVFPICEGTSTSCKCKPNVIGKNCDRCAPNTYDFGPQGCKIGLRWLKYSHGEKCSNAVVGGNEIHTNETIYIARQRLAGNLVPGKLVPSLKSARLTLSTGEYQFDEYEVLCDGSPEWVEARHGEIPPKAVAGGDGENGAETMYVCRAFAVDGVIVPGKLQPSKKTCFIPFNGEESRDLYEVLVQYNPADCQCDTIGSLSPTCEGTSTFCKCKPNVVGKNCDRCAPNTYDFGPQGCKIGLKWLKYSKGAKCSNAVVGGNEVHTNETVYIARHKIAENLIVGKLVPSLKSARITMSPDEYQYFEYEVLCGGMTKWVRARNGEVPPNAVAGGRTYGENGAETMYVCRAFAMDGVAVPGKLQPSKKTCIIPFNGEKSRDQYEVLVQHNPKG